MPCIRTGRPAICAIRRCASVAEPKPEPEGTQSQSELARRRRQEAVRGELREAQGDADIQRGRADALSLANMIGERNAARIMQTHGITPRLGSLLTAIPRLREEFDISGDGLIKFMSNSVAARLNDEAFWAGLTRLGGFGIVGPRLVTFMSNSVAARLEDEAFWERLTRLGDFGIVGPKLATFMSESVAVRLCDQAFWAGLRRLHELGISGDGLVTFMSGSVAARLEDEAFWAGLARLGELGITGDGLVAFMSNSVAARLDNHGFMDGLSSLCSELSPLVVIGLLKNNNVLASRLTAEYARSVLSITRHLDSHGLDGAKCLKTLIGKSAPLAGKVPELVALLLSLDSPDRIEGELQRFRGPYAHKRAMAATL